MSDKFGDDLEAYMSLGRDAVLGNQVKHDFDIYQEAYQESIQKNKDSSCI